MRLLISMCIVFLLTLSGCKKDAGGVLLRFHNTSDLTITQLRVADKDIGKLKPGKRSFFKLYDHISYSGTSLYEYSSATIDGRPFTGPVGWCWTGVQGTNKGVYNIDIQVHPATDHIRLSIAE